jgi:mono/diheme cytochrome c family protein
MQVNAGIVDNPTTVLPADTITKPVGSLNYNAAGKPSDTSPWGLPWSAVWMVNSFDRGYWLTDDPLPVTTDNLLKGKAIFIQRCIGCHGQTGDGLGPAAQFFNVKPFSFADSGQVNSAIASDGMMYHRILTAGKGTAMENFGTRLSVTDIWRVVMFLKTIPNGTLDSGRIPTPKDYIVWQPSDELKAWLADHQKLTDNVDFSKNESQDPYFQMARRMFPGLAPGDEIVVNGLGTTLSLQNAADGIRQFYEQLLDKAWRDAAARGEKLPDPSQKEIPPTVPGE